MFDANTDTTAYSRCLRLDADGDPRWWDEFGPITGALSGEWAEVTSKILDMADVSELWTIARSAAILDSHSPNVATVKLEAFAESLTDDHRRELVTFMRDHTGARPRRATAQDTRVPFAPLSVWQDHQPGYGDHDTQPTGLTVYPGPWETQRARRMTQLTRALRDRADQLPTEARAGLSVVDTAVNRKARRNRKARAQQRAERAADDYMRKGLNVEDRTMPRIRTVFDIDDDTPDTQDQPDGYALDYDRAALTPFRTTPCVFCFIERPWSHDRNSRLNPRPATTTPHHDDGLCAECRADGRPGLPQRPQPSPRPTPTARTVAYLNPKARTVARQAATITAPCAAVAAHLPPAAALVWVRAYYRLAPKDHHPIIEQWVEEWRDAQRPQPPTPITPAAPVPALAAA